MVSEVHGCLAALGERFPGYKNQGYEIEGFVWFQGWNDQYQDRWLTYEKNMANFIRDVRKEFKAPNMPFVIGQMGHDGMKPDKEGSPRDYIKKAQAAVPNYPEFKGNVSLREDRPVLGHGGPRHLHRPRRLEQGRQQMAAIRQRPRLPLLRQPLVLRPNRHGLRRGNDRTT